MIDSSTEPCFSSLAEKVSFLPKKALIAVKDSRASLHAFYEALALARLGIQLVAVSIAPLYEGDLSLAAPPTSASRNEPFQTVLDEALRIAQSQNVALQTYLATGPVGNTIVDMSCQNGFDLIILGHHAGWRLPGNAVARLIRQSPIDVLVIPEKRPLQFNHIFCSAIGASAMRAKCIAMQLAHSSNGRLTVFSDQISHGPSPQGTTTLKTSTTIEAGNTSWDLIRNFKSAAAAGNADLLVIGEMRLTDRCWFMKKSSLQFFLQQAACPLWIIKKPFERI